jgi:2-hydroxy-3-keto-5-methylthiopentenyl-1-phosphate phosphatase
MPRVTAPTLALRADDLIISDFDATISVIDTGLAMINALSPEDAATAWKDEYAWRRGEINSMECLRRQWRLFRKTPEEVWDFVDGLELDEGFFGLLRLVRERGAGIAVVSDGLDFYCDRLFARRGLRTCDDDTCVRSPDCLLRFSNAATVTPEGIQISFPYRHECGQCGNCKTAHLFRLRRGFTRVIYLGDGHSDLCAARYADVIFAKHTLAEDCRRAGRRFFPFATFSDVLHVLR